MNKTKNNRFSLYYLEEGEVYIKEYLVELKENDSTKKSGILYLGSRSFTFEPDNEQLPIEKYMFKSIGNYVIKDQDNKIVRKGSYQETTKEEQLFISTNDNNNNLDMGSNLSSSFKSKFDFMAYFKRKITITEINQPFAITDQPATLDINFIYEKGIKTLELFMKVIHLFQTKTGFESDSINILDMFYKFEFDLTRIKTISEISLLKKEVKVNKIIPLIEVPGTLMLTDKRIYYQPVYLLNSKKSYSIEYNNIIYLHKRRIKLKEKGMEIEYLSSKNKQKRSLLLEFDSSSTREMIFEKISQNILPEMLKRVIDTINLPEMTKKWIAGEITNYEYLMTLNSIANRTRNDLSQYPVMPWVLTNYTSLEIDLKDHSNYRDLSRPIGKLNEKRFRSFKERFFEMPEPRYLYGTHYSTPAYVIGYLVRLYPLFMLKLQTGKFDHPDRLFSSIEIDWHVCLTNPGSLKELIPEFYEEDPGFLLNNLELKLGLKNNGVSHHIIWQLYLIFI